MVLIRLFPLINPPLIKWLVVGVCALGDCKGGIYLRVRMSVCVWVCVGESI